MIVDSIQAFIIAQFVRMKNYKFKEKRTLFVS